MYWAEPIFWYEVQCSSDTCNGFCGHFVFRWLHVRADAGSFSVLVRSRPGKIFCSVLLIPRTHHCLWGARESPKVRNLCMEVITRVCWCLQLFWSAELLPWCSQERQQPAASSKAGFLNGYLLIN